MILARVAMLGLIAMALAGCDDRSQEIADLWRGAVVVKICIDGSHIYRLSNGEYRTGGLGGGTLVDNPNTVCATK